MPAASPAISGGRASSGRYADRNRTPFHRASPSSGRKGAISGSRGRERLVDDRLQPGPGDAGTYVERAPSTQVFVSAIELEERLVAVLDDHDRAVPDPLPPGRAGTGSSPRRSASARRRATPGRRRRTPRGTAGSSAEPPSAGRRRPAARQRRLDRAVGRDADGLGDLQQSHRVRSALKVGEQALGVAAVERIRCRRPPGRRPAPTRRAGGRGSGRCQRPGRGRPRGAAG